MKIAIFGLARSGLSVFRFLSSKTDHEIYLVNQGTPTSWPCYSQIKDQIEVDHCVDEDYAQDLFCQVDLIVLSPGITRGHNSLRKAFEANVEIISEIEFTFRHADIPVIAITGTNGKTTTTTMIGQCLELAGKKPFVCGNIGRPFCDILMEPESYDYAVVELSSFQLESIVSFHAHIAIILNITFNHAERYKNMEDYKNAKFNIFLNQTDKDYQLINSDLLSDFKRFHKDMIRPNLEIIQPLTGFSYSQSHLIGDHNKMNFYCTYKVLAYLNISNLDQLFQKFIDLFKGVKFRLEYINKFHELKIYNDGKSTNDAATLAAVKSFQGVQDLYLILGGQPRSSKITLNETLKDQKIKKIFAYGQASKMIEENLGSHFDLEVFDDIPQIFERIKKTKPIGILLFSPGFPSFDQYEDYVSRGNHFTRLAKELV